MLPLSDGIRARRFPVVNVLLIVANFAVLLSYELPHLNAALYHASFYPCTVDNACRGPEPWGLSWITAMFLHGGWDHILGNMLFLAIFGKNVEDAYGPLRYLVFYFAGGFAAMTVQTAITLLFSTAAVARVPELGASGAPLGRRASSRRARQLSTVVITAARRSCLERRRGAGTQRRPQPAGRAWLAARPPHRPSPSRPQVTMRPDRPDLRAQLRNSRQATAAPNTSSRISSSGRL
jgi:hypothetical protein